MLDLRPVGHVTGLLLLALAVTMLGPLVADLAAGNGHWRAFLESAAITGAVGAALTLATAGQGGGALTIRQTFVLTSTVWLVLPFFAAIPFVFGATEARLVDAMFESMSGITTTGATVFVGLQDLPEGLLLWRGILQWLGGVGIIVMAMVFLPELKVGGMQVFRSEAFETMGKILPRAAEIASGISLIYVGMTVACALAYMVSGMTPFDSVVHAMTTMSTGGFANTDASFGAYGAAAHYIAVVFMILAALPFIRFVQLAAGTARPLFVDSQIRAFLLTAAACTLLMTWAVGNHTGDVSEPAFREALFNVVSIITGTGFASADYMQWGPFAVTLFFFIGLIGGCAGSTACSVKIFRYQILFAVIRARVREIHKPHGIFVPRYEGVPLTRAVLNSVMAFFVVFILSVGIVSILLSMTGLDFITSVSGAATALANVGPGLGPVIGPAGNFSTLNDTAKWILTVSMFVGRLELMVVLVMLTRRFWRD